MRSFAHSAVLALATASSLVAACHDHSEQWNRVRRATVRTDEASAAVSTNATDECTVYGLASVTNLETTGKYPPIWTIANMSSASASDLALFTTLNSTIPNIAAKGTSTGDFTGVSYDGTTDPDCWWTWKQCTSPKISGLQADVTRCAEPNTWGFTLDDGPNCSHNAYYDYLNSVNQKATLFYIGSNVFDWPLEAQRGLDEGHEICAHTWSHRYMTSLTNEEVFAELYYSKKALKDILGVTVQCWRPPYGDVDDRVRYIAQALGMATVIWEDNTFDYLISTTNKTYIDDNYKAILAKQKAGAYNTAGTILNNFTMQESEEFLPQIQGNFSQVLPIAVCNNNSNPYLETGFAYPNFEQWASGTRTISVVSATVAATPQTISIPLSTGITTSLFVAGNYATGAATVGASAAGTSLGGSVQATAASTGGSAAATSTSQTAAASRASFEIGGLLVALAVTVCGMMGGAALL
ncbi:chitin deacetylase, carbohydrate esterase family 4 protein [Pseudohyphozyma bogoriensis]|nr:chitin deacetylase, carbohydrate esterase family 4 protein [Pseudohyphozyma bogoriensis]